MNLFDLSFRADTDYQPPVPKGLKYLPFQRAGIEYALKVPSCIIADEMGLGKTIQAIGVINALGADVKKVLVVCPASLCINWKRELAKWITTPIEAAILSYEQATKSKNIMHWDVLIADEAQYLKSPEAKRTKAVLAVRAKRKLFLTGTPIQNRPIEIWSILNAIQPGVWGSRHDFGVHFCQAYQRQQRVKYKRRDGTMGVKIVTVWCYDGANNLAELRERMRSTCMVRRLKKDVQKDLPAKIRQLVELPNEEAVPSELWAQIKKLVDKKVSGISKEAVESLPELRVAFEKMAMLRHDQALQKAPIVVSHVKDLLESTDKVVVFAHHRDVMQLLIDNLAEFGCVHVAGGMSDRDKQCAVDRFQKDSNCRVFVGQIQAAGVGLTLTAASTVVFAELDWVPGNMSQCEDRCHRIGQKNTVLVQHLVLEQSLDAKIAKALIRKQSVIDAALDMPALTLEDLLTED